MKKSSKRLVLSRDTMRRMTSNELPRALAGICGTACPACETGPIHPPYTFTDTDNPDTRTAVGCV